MPVNFCGIQLICSPIWTLYVSWYSALLTSLRYADRAVAAAAANDGSLGLCTCWHSRDYWPSMQCARPSSAIAHRYTIAQDAQHAKEAICSTTLTQKIYLLRPRFNTRCAFIFFVFFPPFPLCVLSVIINSIKHRQHEYLLLINNFSVVVTYLVFIFMYIPCIFIAYYLFVPTNAYIYKIVLQILLHVSVLLHHLQKALILRLLKL